MDKIYTMNHMLYVGAESSYLCGDKRIYYNLSGVEFSNNRYVLESCINNYEEIFYCNSINPILDMIVESCLDIYTAVKNNPKETRKNEKDYNIKSSCKNYDFEIESKDLDIFNYLVKEFEKKSSYKYSVKPIFAVKSIVDTNKGNYSVEEVNMVKSEVDNMYEYEYILTNKSERISVTEKELLSLMEIG